MKVSLNWAQYYSNVDLKSISTDELLKKIGAQLGAVEEVTNWGARYEDVLVAKVVSCEKHPNADRLHVCLIDDGNANKKVARNPDGYVQVVCGAPNVREGMIVAWIPPGATVPATIDTDPFTLEARELRGKVSNGMLASAAELGINDDHSGIVDLNLADLAEGTKLGDSFAKALWLEGELVIDCENKMFTHRPDCFGILGVAREFAGITGQSFRSPDWYLEKPKFKQLDNLPLAVEVAETDLVPRFMAVAIKDVEVKPSPLHIQLDLKRVGIKPINNIVDITNYIMQLTGQPLHAYDYDKVKAHSSRVPTLVARKSKKGESLALLNGKTVTMQDDTTLLIATDKAAIGVGGVMGGSDTEVDTGTKNIILEVATFDMYNIRRTSMKYGLFTDAVTRFNKGQSPLQNDRILTYAIENIVLKTGGKQASKVIDMHGALSQPKKVMVTPEFVNERLGSKLTSKQMTALLKNVEFQVSGDTLLTVQPPFWRTDIEIGEDIVEEIGRLHGYDQLPIALPVRSAKPAPKNEVLEQKTKMRSTLSGAGANEVLTYSFVHETLLQLVGQDAKHAYRLSNALSPDLQYYRMSLLPSLLDKVNTNIRAGSPEFALYEINKVHSKLIVDKDKLPKELEHAAFVFAAEDKIAKQHYEGAPFYQAAYYLRRLLRSFDVAGHVKLVPLSDVALEHAYDTQLVAPFEPKRSAAIVDEKGWFWGVVGEIKTDVRARLKLPSFCAGFEINLGLLAKTASAKPYKPISRFPHSAQDVTYKTAVDVPHAKLTAVIHETLREHSKQHGYVVQAETLDIYQAKNASTKNSTFRITLTHLERTLTTQEVSNVVDVVTSAAEEQCGAERV